MSSFQTLSFSPILWLSPVTSQQNPPRASVKSRLHRKGRAKIGNRSQTSPRNLDTYSAVSGPKCHRFSIKTSGMSTPTGVTSRLAGARANNAAVIFVLLRPNTRKVGVRTSSGFQRPYQSPCSANARHTIWRRVDSSGAPIQPSHRILNIFTPMRCDSVPF